MAGHDGHPQHRLSSWFAGVLGVVAAGVAFRRAATAGGFWFDEAHTARLAELPFGRAMHGALEDIHPPGWPLTAWFAYRLPLPHELALRLPSVLAFALLVAFVARRNPLAGAALLFHAPLLDLGAQARGYALLALAVAVLPAIARAGRLPALGLIAGFAGSLQGAAPMLVATVVAVSVDWRRVVPRDAIVATLLAVLPQAWWLVPWTRRALTYAGDPWYSPSPWMDWTTPTDGIVGLGFWILALLITTNVDRAYAKAGAAVLAALIGAELCGVPIEIRKIGIVLTPLMVLALDAGPRRQFGHALVAAGFLLSTRHIDARPDLRQAAQLVAALPPMPIIGVFPGEVRYYVREPGVLPTDRTAEAGARSVAAILDAGQGPCVAGIHLWDTAPDDELPPGVSVRAWGSARGLDVRLFGTADCVVDPLPGGWHAGHPCEDPEMRAWLCGDALYQ